MDVRGTVLASWAAAKLMREQGRTGVIINMSWDHVTLGMAGENPVLYSAAKGAVMSFSKSFAREVAPDIRVNILAPGFIETAFGEDADPRFRRRGRSSGRRSSRWGTPDDVAAAALFLASDEAKFMTGQMIMVNGGVTCMSGEDGRTATAYGRELERNRCPCLQPKSAPTTRRRSPRS